jgi:hypothetical protein
MQKCFNQESPKTIDLLGVLGLDLRYVSIGSLEVLAGHVTRGMRHNSWRQNPLCFTPCIYPSVQFLMKIGYCSLPSAIQPQNSSHQNAKFPDHEAGAHAGLGWCGSAAQAENCAGRAVASEAQSAQLFHERRTTIYEIRAGPHTLHPFDERHNVGKQPPVARSCTQAARIAV